MKQRLIPLKENRSGRPSAAVESNSCLGVPPSLFLRTLPEVLLKVAAVWICCVSRRRWLKGLSSLFNDPPCGGIDGEPSGIG